MSQSEASARALPASWETDRSEPRLLPGRRASVRSDAYFLDSRLILSALSLGGLLAGGVFCLGSLIPFAAAPRSQAVSMVKAYRPPVRATQTTRLPDRFRARR
jgi:hypothetical protein